MNIGRCLFKPDRIFSNGIQFKSAFLTQISAVLGGVTIAGPQFTCGFISNDRDIHQLG